MNFQQFSFINNNLDGFRSYSMKDNYNIALHDEIRYENKLLNDNTKIIKDGYSSENQKVVYQEETLNYLYQIKTILFIFYYVLTFLFIISIVFYDSNKTNLYLKIFFIIFFLIYPFIISYIINVIYNVLIFFYSAINGNPYEKKII